MLLLLLALLQDKVRLELKAAPGEKSVFTRRESNTGKILVTAAGQTVTENTREVENRRHRDNRTRPQHLPPQYLHRTISVFDPRCRGLRRHLPTRECAFPVYPTSGVG